MRGFHALIFLLLAGGCKAALVPEQSASAHHNLPIVDAHVEVEGLPGLFQKTEK